MKNFNSLLRRFLTLPLLMTGILIGHAGAYEIHLKPGDSQVVDVSENIDTVFVSSPKVADYEVIGNHSLLVYAQSNGSTDLTVFNKDNQQIMKIGLIVDPLLGSLQQQIRAVIPEDTVLLRKVANTYVISGTVETEKDRDNVYKIVGEGAGIKSAGSNSAAQSTSAGGLDKSSLPWLNNEIYSNIINQLKIRATNQVNVKLSVVDVTKTFTDNIGIDWGTIASADSKMSPGTFGFIRFNAQTLVEIIHAISNDNVARVLAEPNLSVLSGETAEFLVGGEVPVVTSSANGTSVQYKEFGIKLNIGAKVNSNQRIRITLDEEVSNIEGAFNITSGETFPTFQTRRAKTTVELADGESFVLGGLINNTEREELARIPWIGDIPLLGAFFRRATTERAHRELIVVATVSLVKPLKPSEVVLPDFQRTSTMTRLFNVNNLVNHRQRKLAQEFVNKGGFIQ